MIRRVLMLSVAGFLAAASLVARPQAAGQGVPAGRASAVRLAEYGPVLDRYCVTCHNDRVKNGGLSLQGHDLAAVPGNAEVWEKVIRKVGSGSMPPLGAARPDAATASGLVTALSDTLDREAATHPNPGRPMIHRLNRAEYANAVRDLLHLNIDVTSLLPPDELSNGFDNIADALGVSPVLIERYLNAADRVAATAVGDLEIAVGGDTYVARNDNNQRDHIEGLPLGTRGGMLIKRNFPVSAEYEISAKLYQTNSGFTGGLYAPHDLEFDVDGQRVWMNTVGTEDDYLKLMANPAYSNEVDKRLITRVPIAAGEHVIGVTFVEKTGARNPTVFKPLQAPVDTVDADGVPRILSVNIAGPFNATGTGNTPSRERIFTCRPGGKTPEKACATTIASTISRRAFRRPATQAELDQLLSYYDKGRVKKGGFESGVQMMVRRILADPAFLFRVERDPANVAENAVYRLGDLDLASRLSFFLWSSIPDDQLLQLAIDGKLHEPATYSAQVARMLADPKADALVSNFAGQWLQLRNLQRVTPDLMEFPDFDDALRQGFRRETELFFGSLLKDNRSVLDLLTADYTFVNERLARHYGLPGVTGTRFRRVAVTDEARRGLLGQGSMLLVTSHPNRTSPVKRGKWVLENLMGSPPPPPPPNVPPLAEGKDAAQPKTMKERMAEHRANPVCANCHKLMDPIGLAMENFDGIGSYRVRDSGVKIDTTTTLSDGTGVNGVVELRQALLARPDMIARTFTENLLTYALGRGVAAEDMPTVRTILRTAAPQKYRMADIVQAITTSTPFQMRIKATAAAQ